MEQKTQLSHAQRFDITVTNNSDYAPLSWGCPSQIMATDYSVFKKTMQEKFTIYGFKRKLGKTKHHKFVTQFKGSF